MLIDRRDFLITTSLAMLGAAAQPKLWAQTPANVRLEIAPLNLEIAPKKIIHTVAYNGRVPGPLIRWPEGKPITIDVVNRTDVPEIVHWHGLWIPSEEDGAAEEGSPMIPVGGQRRYSFTPQPAGFRWYHTHAFAGHDLKRGGYTGQFGCFFIDPKQEPGAYDQEIFLTLHDWNAYMGGGADSSMDAFYDYATINDRMLGHGDPIKVREGQRVLFHVLNASATAMHWLTLAGHEFTVLGMDGNEVGQPTKVSAVRLAPAERVDVLAEMSRPGVWVLGETREETRKAGMGIVVEYANQHGEPKWIDPPATMWDYMQFAKQTPVAAEPDERVPLVFESKFHGHGDFDHWTINGKSYPNTDTIPLKEGKHYRLSMRNKSSDDHPIHLHRHTFEVSSLDGKPLSGLRKDVAVVKANSTAEIDFVAANPGPTLFHCHQQSHMDFGFMMLFRYV
jgi:FtsP/CotA-like multicopper oxidase with cupredoxin domain